MKIDANFISVVTGGASGLGEATSKLLSSLGSKVIIADLNDQRGKELAQQIKGEYFRTDVSNEQNVIALFEHIKQKHGQIHAVVNCAGVIAAGTLIYSKGVASSQEMLRVLKINVIGTFNMCKHGAKMMSEQKAIDGERGVLINVASVAGFDGQKGQSIYSASKGAIIGMTLPMARDLGKFGIRVMTIAPGIFQTPMGSGLQGKTLENLLQSVPLKRLGQSPEFALTVKAIIQNPYASGDTWRLDGAIRLPYL